jgi:hypothetical protein
MIPLVWRQQRWCNASSITHLRQRSHSVTTHEIRAFFYLYTRVAIMAAKYYPEGSAEGLAEARRRIAKAKRTGAEELDLGGLGLVEVPAELFEATQLKVLYLGLPKAAAEKPWWRRDHEEKKQAMR